ncbi:hypothetical protein LP52_24890 [Streptomonospora alba]|uniref:Uncharacterized protein n=1 Tax=Streptomonospora alba TaxID=183763 RepID=A0A0C2FZF1_9ACTN|nr:hypothetical protein [Streptomonospora alba]KIH96438.1 hypothetical protein LP52_24890 [Streptomonospora alba]
MSEMPDESDRSAGGSAADSSGGVVARYKVPAVVGGVVAAVAAVLAASVVLPAGEPFEDVGGCEELFTEEFVSSLHLDEGVRLAELEPGEWEVPSEGELACGDTEGNTLTVVFAVLDPGSEPWDYSGAEDRIAGRRGGADELRSGADEQRPFNAVEVEEIEAGDGGFVALYEPPPGLASDYGDWTPTERGRTHATAHFRVRNVVVRVRSFDAGGPTVRDAPLSIATRVSEGLAERIAEVGEEGDPEPDDPLAP